MASANPTLRSACSTVNDWFGASHPTREVVQRDAFRVIGELDQDGLYTFSATARSSASVPDGAQSAISLLVNDQPGHEHQVKNHKLRAFSKSRYAVTIGVSGGGS